MHIVRSASSYAIQSLPANAVSANVRPVSLRAVGEKCALSSWGGAAKVHNGLTFFAVPRVLPLAAVLAPVVLASRPAAPAYARHLHAW